MPQSQWIILLVAAAVAVAVLLRLYMVLGRRSGTETQGAASGWGIGKVLAPPPAAAEAAPAIPGLFAIQQADKRFDAAKFLDGARTAYRLIVTSFEKGDRDALKPLLSAEVYEGFDAAIAARGAAAPPYTLSDIREARILSGTVENGVMEITVSFTAAYQSAAAIGAPQDVADVWSFTRQAGAADPNWILAATSGEAR
jgi:predicted lipid-binding transport protein (Tim44 family)